LFETASSAATTPTPTRWRNWAPGCGVYFNSGGTLEKQHRIRNTVDGEVGVGVVAADEAVSNKAARVRRHVHSAAVGVPMSIGRVAADRAILHRAVVCR